MTLAQIMTLALRQLDEDAQDLSEYESAFKVYANIGYDIAVREYLKPKEWFEVKTDERGEAIIDDHRILRVVKVKEAKGGRETAFSLLEDGTGIATKEKNARLNMLCEVGAADMTLETDEPILPRRVHHALADYICFRHLSCGNMAKQAKAQFFLTGFHQAMRTLRPQGMGSAKAYENLYAQTDIRNVR